MGIKPAAADAFCVPSCAHCGGVVKPAVTFFGGSVPPPLVQAAADAVAAADALLVVGSSMQVFSAYRIARSAAAAGLPPLVFGRAAGLENPRACRGLGERVGARARG